MDNNSEKSDTCPYCGVPCSNNTWTEISQNKSEYDHDISHEITCKGCGGKWGGKIDISVPLNNTTNKNKLTFFDEGLVHNPQKDLSTLRDEMKYLQKHNKRSWPAKKPQV